ncbi:hypothetical protein [Pseudoalteromonas sp. OOF1S-7]|uniref:hypothetical protein n=1 Tax=Pseudoalteromonas sp. OOF1S-7 TaxID=2917757 RepID=UPI001EF607EA|nr:hypothetical protein [Pseudoalteromonas sp. OOF1S-7]MCG7537068.1 hypothetical protein [Pseudoalteromonas sp. OOF1S-7]
MSLSLNDSVTRFYLEKAEFYKGKYGDVYNPEVTFFKKMKAPINKVTSTKYYDKYKVGSLFLYALSKIPVFTYLSDFIKFAGSISGKLSKSSGDRLPYVETYTHDCLKNIDKYLYPSGDGEHAKNISQAIKDYGFASLNMAITLAQMDRIHYLLHFCDQQINERISKIGNIKWGPKKLASFIVDWERHSDLSRSDFKDGLTLKSHLKRDMELMNSIDRTIVEQAIEIARVEYRRQINSKFVENRMMFFK